MYVRVHVHVLVCGGACVMCQSRCHRHPGAPNVINVFVRACMCMHVCVLEEDFLF